MFTTVTTNGMLLNKNQLGILHDRVDLIAISLDGVPASHNRMRGSSKAFDTMASKLDLLRQDGVAFGFIFTLTRHNAHELDWVAEFSLAQGARLLQVHPLEIVGRAEEMIAGDGPGDDHNAFAFLELSRLRDKVGDRMYLQLDLFDRDLIRTEPGRVLASDTVTPFDAALLADLVSPLVIEPDGTVAPIRYGFARAYAMGNLQRNRLRDLASRWVTERYPAFRDLCNRVYATVSQPADLPFFNWYELVAKG